MRVLVVGATGGSGRAAVEALVAQGHEVTAFSRHADRSPERDRPSAIDRAIFALLLRPQIADTEQQEREVRASGLDWVLAQPERGA